MSLSLKDLGDMTGADVSIPTNQFFQFRLKTSWNQILPLKIPNLLAIIWTYSNKLLLESNSNSVTYNWTPLIGTTNKMPNVSSIQTANSNNHKIFFKKNESQ